MHARFQCRLLGPNSTEWLGVFFRASNGQDGQGQCCEAFLDFTGVKRPKRLEMAYNKQASRVCATAVVRTGHSNCLKRMKMYSALRLHSTNKCTADSQGVAGFHRPIPLGRREIMQAVTSNARPVELKVSLPECQHGAADGRRTGLHTSLTLRAATRSQAARFMKYESCHSLQAFKTPIKAQKLVPSARQIL